MKVTAHAVSTARLTRSCDDDLYEEEPPPEVLPGELTFLPKPKSKKSKKRNPVGFTSQKKPDQEEA